MAPNNTSTKMSVDFDLTDIEDIDAISDEFDADPSSDDDTFISNKNKKITKKREKRLNILNNNNSSNTIIESYEKIIITKEESPKKLPTFQNLQDKNEDNDSEEEEDEKKDILEKIVALKLNGPTDHFDELEKQMNGPGWMVTSSSATQSEDELGAFERDEFSFKMCQVIRRSGRTHEKRRKHHMKHQKIVRNVSEDASTISKTETSTTEPQASDDSSDGENMLKYCNRSVPLAKLSEDDL